MASCLRCGRVRGCKAARKLCHACYCWCWRRDELDQYPTSRTSTRTDALLEDWQVVARSTVAPLRDLAARIGIRPKTLERALCRARAAGDPRAIHHRWQA